MYSIFTIVVIRDVRDYLTIQLNNTAAASRLGNISHLQFLFLHI